LYGFLCCDGAKSKMMAHSYLHLYKYETKYFAEMKWRKRGLFCRNFGKPSLKRNSFWSKFCQNFAKKKFC
jgi:hypothetical protein